MDVENAKYNASKAVDWEERLLMPVSITKIIAQTMVTFVIFALALFIPAGTVAWQAGWIFLGMFFVWFIAVNMWLFKHNPGLLQERMKLGRSDQKGMG